MKSAGVLDKLRLIVWKNRIIRKRHWSIFLLELIIPTGLMCLAVFLRVFPNSDMVPIFIDDNTTFTTYSENDLKHMLCSKSLGGWLFGKCRYGDVIALPTDRKLFWGPVTPFTTEIIKKVQTQISFEDEYLESVSSNEEMNDLVDRYYLESNISLNAFYIGIFFHLLAHDEIPNMLNYDLRLQNYWYTRVVYPFLEIPGPRTYSVFDTSARYDEDGFILLQTLVDRAYISVVSGNEDIYETVKIEAQMYPYPPYLKDNGINELYGSLIPTIIVFSLVLLSPTLIKSIVHEKETGVRELIRMMGMGSWLNWLGWFLYTFTVILIVSLIDTFLFKVRIKAEDDQILPGIFPNSSPSVLFVFMILYGISAICFCFAISCFFNRPSLATTIGVLVWVLTFYMPRALMEPKYNTLGLMPKLFSCLIPNMAMTWFFRIVCQFEGKGTGAQWDLLWESGNSEDQLTVGLIMVMVSFDIFLFLSTTWYCDQVMPGEYGVPKPWYFIFQIFSGGVKNQGIEIRENVKKIQKEEKFFEEEPIDHSAGIRIKNLRKEFNTGWRRKVKTAVDGAFLTCFSGQCTVLLGHNGAGKTTTVSVLTGVYPPTDGYAEVNGYNIATDLEKARSYIGLCPQQNTIFIDLSVKEHLLFFARLKGLEKMEAKKETVYFLDKLQLQEKRNDLVKNLSGGMKRKLCLAIALIGGSQVVILDEPTSGIDPESRRWVWSVLQEERLKRTILVITHHMEEADVLGDRIAIMSDGKIISCGSSLFLKNTFGEGYSLILTAKSKLDVYGVTEEILCHLPGSYLKENNDQYLKYILPNKTEVFGKLLDHLTLSKNKFGILYIGLQYTSMEEVFMKASKDKEEIRERKLRADEDECDQTNTSQKDTRGLIAAEKLEGIQLSICRFKTLIKKKAIYSKRKWIIIITQAVIPVIVTLLCLAVDASYSSNVIEEPPVILSMDMFEHTFSFVDHDLASIDIAKNYADLFTDPYQVTSTNNLSNSLLIAADEDLTEYRESHITSAEFYTVNGTLTTKLMYQSIPWHCAGIGTNIIDNALIRTLLPNENYTITTNNFPLPPNKDWKLDADQTTYSSALYSMSMPIALAFLSSSFLIFPLNERTSKAKQIQLMTGTSAVGLWTSAFLWDMITYSLSAIIIFICFMAFDTQSHFTVHGAPGTLFLLLFLYGIGSIPMSYVFSFLFETSASGFAVSALINVIFGMIIGTVVLILELVNTIETALAADIIGLISSFIPAYAASKGFKNIIDMGTYNSQCEFIKEYQRESLCATITEHNPESLYMPCCPQCSQFGKCFEPLDYLNWGYPGVGFFIFFLFIDAIFYGAILVLIEIGFFRKIRHLYRRLKRAVKNPDITKSFRTLPKDNDVINEEELSSRLIQKSSPDVAIVVERLEKVFPNGLAAVNGISLHVKKGECFGLLGVNGAGKSTTFRMLTGDAIPTSGEARIGNDFLSTNKRQFLCNVGYCPQFDAIIGELSGEQMLGLMAGLRGVTSGKREKIIQAYVELLGLEECGKRPSRTFSGGNKRKLSTAMALIGDPPLTFLDEPTSGVDPDSRRKIWRAVRYSLERNQSIILTSHSMDECEALCSRLVIMDNGAFQCIGTSQHLKQKYGPGYSLQMKMRKFNKEEYHSLVKALKEYMASNLINSKIIDEHKGSLSYKISEEYKWSYIFNVMEVLKNENYQEAKRKEIVINSQLVNIIEYYAVMESSLEEIFLSFARREK